MVRSSRGRNVNTSGAGVLAPPDMHISPKILAGLNTTHSFDSVYPSIKEQLAMSSQYDTDVVVIGSGPGGYYAAIRAAQLGAKTVIVEKNSVGGTCLNVGCIPTKVLLSSVGVLNSVKRGAEFGVKVSGYEMDIPTMQKRKSTVVKQLVGGVEGLLRKNKTKLMRGFGRIVDAHTVAVDTDGGTETIKTDKIILATGSTPAIIPIPGLAIGGNVWTSNEALEFSSVPKSMVIIGAGAIGLEFGYTFARIGADVTVVELMPQILPAADTETAKELQKHLEKAGMKFILGSTVTHAEDANGGKRVFIKSGDKEQSVDVEVVLMAVGRRTAMQGIGLDEVGIKYDKRKVLTNEYMQTNVPNIYAIGDVVGEPMLAHVAWAEAVVAVEHAMGVSQAKMDYSAFPACVYTTPECASVGLTEAQANERYKDVKIGKFGYTHNGKAMGLGEAEGFVKVISEGRFGQVLGVHMVGPHVTDLITEMAVAIRNELTVDEIIATIHPHPTLSEVVQEAAMDVYKRAIHK